MEQIEVSSRTEDELTQLVKDMYEGKVFYNGMLKEGEEAKIYRIFLPMEQIELNNLVNWDDVGMVFEYGNKAIDFKDGIPIFKTINFVHCNDMYRMTDIFVKLDLSKLEHKCGENCNHNH